MKLKIYGCLLAFFVLTFALPVFAHERDTYTINGKQYQIVIGSLNEPVVVDDKSGVDLTVTMGIGAPTKGPDGDMDGPPAQSVPVGGLDKTLKVEISAGSQKKTLDLVPAYGKDGSYTATFYPTLQTTFSYRLFGSINGTPVDLSFSCSQDSTAMVAQDKTLVKLTDQIIRTSKAGAFGCPLAKADLGFPVASVSNADLNSKLNSPVPQPQGESSTRGLAIAALALSVIGLTLAGRKNLKK